MKQTFAELKNHLVPNLPSPRGQAGIWQLSQEDALNPHAEGVTSNRS